MRVKCKEQFRFFTRSPVVSHIVVTIVVIIIGIMVVAVVATIGVIVVGAIVVVGSANEVVDCIVLVIVRVIAVTNLVVGVCAVVQ